MHGTFATIRAALWDRLWKGLTARWRRSPSPQHKEDAAPIPAQPRETSPQRKEAVRIAKLRHKISSEINAVLDRFAKLRLADLENPIGGNFSRRNLAEIMASDFHFLELTGAMPGGDKWGMLNPDGLGRELSEATWPIDIGTIFRGDKDYWNLTLVKTVDPASLRGRVRIVPRKMVMIYMASFWDDGTWFADDTPAGLIGNKWVMVDSGVVRGRHTGSVAGDTVHSGRRITQELRDTINEKISASFSMALTERYSWHAAFGAGDSGMRLLLGTNPTGCLDLFRNRKKGSAETRRPALRHWVGNHLRNLPDAETTYVRDHLRGATEFEWHDLACQLQVSEFDLEKNELFRLEAEQWRRNRKHNRRRAVLRRQGWQ